jgi:hypothetical protein
MATLGQRRYVDEEGCALMARTHVMTEAEWRSSNDPTPMLAYLKDHASERKMRLLACACCRRIWDHLPDPRSRQAVEVAERFADDQATPRELARARAYALTVAGGAAWAAYWAANVKAAGPRWNAFAAAAAAPAKKAAEQTQKGATWDSVHAESVRDQVELIREVIGNPFRSCWLAPAWLAWEGGLVVQLAEMIYEEQAFERMPILGDALEEAGCTDEEILDHCRRGGHHVRGCWALDLVLGRE